ncbi:MAG: sigma 54-interacting transcriptional regulator [Kofleriaceae bacterium]|jgi:two-component system response regulator AtoC|nr:sigma 54-interacting transcriptional regulator [Kofleriaceae bacterium]
MPDPKLLAVLSAHGAGFVADSGAGPWNPANAAAKMVFMDERTARQGPEVPGTIRDGDVLLIAGKGRVWTHTLTAGKRTCVVGRDPECDVVLDDRVLSRQHVRIDLGPPLTVQDLGSTNGTKVGGKAFHGGGPVPITPGESFHVGAYSFVIMAPGPANPSTQRSALELMSVPDPTPGAATPLLTDIARSEVNVLVLGESGVGKELLAETIHLLSGRRGPLQKVNCAALAEQLLESELFGHEKGAFTGAVSARPGLLEAAEGGTVFLDEIGELPLPIQAKLLRAIEAREVQRLGATRTTSIDVRWVCATNRELTVEVAEKRFRHDLYFRIDGISLRIPPLRERRGMIARLAMGFAQRAGNNGGLSSEVLGALEAYDWPGNVRELKAVIERGVLLARGRPLSVSHLAFTARAAGPGPTAGPGRADEARPRPGVTAPPPAAMPNPAAAGPDLPDLSDLDPEQRADRTRIIQALDDCAGNQTRAAAALGISRTTLVTKLRIYRIPRPRS